MNAVALPQRNQQIEGVTGKFQGHIDRQQLDAADQEHQGQGASGQQKVEFWMVVLFNPPQLRADTDYQKKPGGQDEFEDLRKKVHPIDIKE